MRSAYIPAIVAALLALPSYAFAETPSLVSVTLQSNNTNTVYARTGDNITVNLTGSEDLTAVSITIQGQPVLVRTFSDPKFYFGSYVVSDTDTEGDVVFAIEYENLGGEQGLPVTTSTNGVHVRIDRTPPVVSAVPDISVEGDVAGGGVVTYTHPDATDTESGTVPTTCSPDSGALFSVGTTTVTCSASDAAGNIGTVTFSVVVTDTAAPTISLVGSRSMRVTRGEVFTDPGATATDTVDTEVPVVVTGSVDTSRAGDYTLTYTATDDSGNETQVTREVSVVRSSGGGGGGGSSASRPSVEPEGEVLGASAYNFNRMLTVGSTGDDVTQLQKLLANLGYFSEAPTGYYGALTQAAVSSYQRAKGLEAVGFVGPRTLLALNGETVVSTQNTAATLAQLYAELERLMAQLRALKGES